MKDSKEGEVIISDVNTLVFKEMLRFIYTGSARADAVDLSELFGIAHRYNVKGLQQFCASKLAASLSAENVAERLVLATTFNQESLEEQCLSFINAHLSEVLKTNGFDQLTKTCPQVLASILKAQINPTDKEKEKKKSGRIGRE